MTPRQRFLAPLEGRRPDRVPTDYRSTPEFHARLMRDLGCTDSAHLCERLHIDQPRSIDAPCLRPHHPDDPEADIWGVRTTPVDYGTGIYHEVTHHPLASATSVADVHAFHWPNPDDFDYDAIGPELDADDGQRAIRSGVYEPFLLHGSMRGLQQSYEDLALCPDIADAILGHIFDFCYEHNRRIFEAGRGRIDVFTMGEDLGSQTGPLMSLSHYRRFLRPNQKRMADLGRTHGIHIFYHTDGAARPFLPDLIDVVGIEVLDPIQWRCPGMERRALASDFGGRIGFHGAMDNQYTLPFGTVDEVIAEVRENLAIFADARWYCAPCHNIQSVSPTANIVAMYETIHELGKL